MNFLIKKWLLRSMVIIAIIFTLALLYSCKKLNETFEGHLTQDQVGGNTSSNTAALLQGVYTTFHNTLTDHTILFSLTELTTDAAILPTRGSDWDDNGVWRVLHQQKWDANNTQISLGFNRLCGIVYAATDMLRYSPTQQEQAEARFLRACAMYLLLDLFDQVPYREAGENIVQPAKVRKGLDAWNYIIGEINAITNDLPEVPVHKANKFAAKVLLMKCYLNKAVYTNRETPPQPATADMDRVINLADSVIKSPNFSFSANYFDNFAPHNTTSGFENIFTQTNVGGGTPGNILHSAWFMLFHYHMNPSGWNGFATLSDFYDKFEAADKRREDVYPAPGFYPNPGNRLNIGFLAGQQYHLTTDAPLKDRLGGPLFFTREVKNLETGSNREVTGIRPIKYFPDLSNPESPDNDFVFFRLSDVLLMKAEAILRGGTGTHAGSYGKDATSIVNAIRTHATRNASALSSVTLDNLIDERARELWWEGWRRQDMIRFGEYLLPFQAKEYQSDPKYLLFPIPVAQLAVNPNLEQNPGY